jgi:hypothetical protein
MRGSRFSAGGHTDMTLPAGIENIGLSYPVGSRWITPYRTSAVGSGAVMSSLFGRLGGAPTVFGGRISLSGCLSGGHEAADESPVVLVAITRVHGWTVLPTRSAPIRVWSMGKQGLAGPI